MQNLKVKVNSAEESKEAQELFFELGYELFNKKSGNKKHTGWVVSFKDGDLCLDYEDVTRHKKITIPQLKDMVILKRNNVGDATHNTHKCGALGYLTSDNAEYMWDYSIKKWTQNRAWSFHKYEMKPIQNNDLPFIDSEKDVKEYLEPMPNGDYRYHIDDGFSIGGDWIEIPEGANFYCDNHFWKQLNSRKFWNGDNWQDDEKTLLSFSKSFNCHIVWQRNPQEESINDKVASAEVARQKQPNQKTIDAMRESEDIINKKHSHYKKDISHLGFIDVYRVLNLFEVESHAVGHAIKKLLCSGQRGAKDKAQDIQEAIDSLNRELQIMKEDESNG